MAIKKQSYAGLCEEWVEDVTGESIQGDTAYDSWQNFYKNKKGVIGENGMQPGDLIYFASDPKSAYGTDGHVGIYNGNGLFTSATDSGVATASVNDWAQHNNQYVLGYIPRKELGTQKGRGGGTMAGADPNALVKIKSSQGQELQVKVSDLPAYGLSADNIPQSAYINSNGAGNTSTTSPSGSQGGSNVPSAPTSFNKTDINSNVASTIDKPAQNYVQGQQDISKNALDITKMSLDNQIAQMQADQTLAPRVLGADLQDHKMTLKDAIQKYVGHGLMKRDDVIQQYNAVNNDPNRKQNYGPMKESLAQLNEYAPTPDSLQHKQDVHDGIIAARDLQQKWNDWASDPSNMDKKRAYDVATQVFGDSVVKSLGTAKAQGIITAYKSQFPDTDPLHPLNKFGATGGFNSVEDMMLKESGGYTYKLLDLPPPKNSDGQQSSNEQEKLNLNPIQNVANDASDTINSLVSLFSQGAGKHIKGKQDATNAKEMGGAVLSDLGKTTGVSVNNGKVKIDPGQALIHDYNHPLSTISWLAPFLKGAKVAGILGKAGDAAKTAEEAGNVVKATKAQKLISKMTDLARGKGSKEYISRNVDTGVSQNQILNDENILSHPTQSGKIEATQRALNKYGAQIGDAYEKSKITFTGDDISKELTQQLKSDGYDQRAINGMLTYLNGQGGFNLAKGDSVISAKQLWKAAQKLEESPPKMMKNPESMAAYREMARKTARFLRDTLSGKLKNIKGLNKKYETLKDFQDSLTDPTGIQPKGGFFETVGHVAGNATETPLNWAYKGAGGIKGVKAPSIFRKTFPFYYAASDVSKGDQQQQ